MPPNLRILIVDDSEDDALLIGRALKRGGSGVEFLRVESAPEMSAALAEGGWDAVISDVNMPGFSATTALALYHQAGLQCPFVVVSGMVGEEAAVSLLKEGAHDFVLKNNLGRLLPVLEREFEDVEMRRARAEAEAALRASEERYALAMLGANDGLWDWDLAAGSVYYSLRWKQMLGFDDDEIGSTPDEWLGRLHPDDLIAVCAAIDEHLRNESPHFTTEHRLRQRNGEWLWVHVRGLAVRDEHGQPYRMAGSFTDITAQKRWEQQLQQAKDELESALAAKTRFLAAASHDLRQPVQALFCFTGVLQSQLQGMPAQHTVRELSGALDGLKLLLDSLLDVSKLDAGIVSPELATVSLAAVLDEVAAQMRPAAESKGLRLRVVPCDVPVRTDPVLAGRILRNLAENAIRYTEHGGVLIGARRRGDTVRVEVWDSGIGVRDDLKDKIFEEFFQVGNPERDRRKGLGLGLAIVKRLSHLLGHPLDVRSRAGHGSVFSLTLPIGEAAEAPVPPSEPEGRLRGSVLIIDDEAAVARSTAALVGALGYDACAVESAEQALQMVDGGCVPSAIIADYRLRDGETGIDAIRLLCQRCSHRVPSLLMTGDTAPDRLREAEAAGILTLHKPVRPAELERALARLVNDQADRVARSCLT